MNLHIEGAKKSRWIQKRKKDDTCRSTVFEGDKDKIKKGWGKHDKLGTMGACEHPPCCYISVPSGFRQTVCWAPSAGAQKLLHSSSSCYCWKQRPSSPSPQIMSGLTSATRHISWSSVSSSFKAAVLNIVRALCCASPPSQTVFLVIANPFFLNRSIALVVTSACWQRYTFLHSNTISSFKGTVF